MQINVTYDSSVANAPAGFETVIADVVQYYDDAFADPITVNIDVGWGEVDGQSLSRNDLGENFSNYTTTPYTYAQIKAALGANAVTAEDQTALASLPSTDPTNGGVFAMTTAEAKALGLMGPSTAIDGWAGFTSAPSTFDFSVTSNDSGAVAQGEYDFFGVVAHEFSEIMGRQTNFGINYGQGPGDGSGYYPMDLFDFTAPGVRSFDGDTFGRYFSIDGGVTDINNFNQDPHGDQFDWESGLGGDAYDAFSSPGIVNPVSAGDLTLMDVLGYIPTPDFTAAEPLLVGETLSTQIGDTSQGPAPATTAGVYVSTTDLTPTTADTLLASIATPAIVAGGTVSVSTTLPLANLAPGSYDLDVIADANGAVAQMTTQNDTSAVLGIGILDDSNAIAIGADPYVDAYDLGGLDLAGVFNVTTLYVAAALDGSGELQTVEGNVTFAPGATLGIAEVDIAGQSVVDVDTSLACAGTWIQGFASGALTIGADDVLDLSGAANSFLGPVRGAGVLEIAGGGTTFGAGAALTIHAIDLTGATTQVSVDADLLYTGVWRQAAGGLTVAAGDELTFGGFGGDAFSGTLAGAGTVSFEQGADALGDVTLSAAKLVFNGADVTVSGAVVITGVVSVNTPSLTLAADTSLSGGGALILTNRADNRVAGAASADTLTNVGDRILGAGQLGGGQMALVNDGGGVIDADYTIGLIIDTGANTIANAGLIENTGAGGLAIDSALNNAGVVKATRGTLTVNGPVTGDGRAVIRGGELDFASGFDQSVAFTGGGELALADAVSYAAVVSGFSKTGATSLDLRDIAFGPDTAATFSGGARNGVLTVTNGTDTARVRLAGDYLTQTFSVSADDDGGTLVVASSPASASAQPLIAAMASLAPTPAARTIVEAPRGATLAHLLLASACLEWGSNLRALA